MTIKNLVEHYLVSKPETRDNDNLLIAYIIMDFYKTDNLFEIANATSSNVYESIRRCRQRIQEINPILQSSEKVRKGRNKKEQHIREEMRGL